VNTDYDYVVIGAGCAGLSLSVHLLEAGLGSRRVLILDPRTDFPNDRTWCFFDVHPHPFEAAVSHRWRRWRVADTGAVVEQSSNAYAYQYLPGNAFYRLALSRIDGSESYELALGCRADSVRDRGDHVVVETSRGPITARLAFDGRPGTERTFPGAEDGTREVRLLQHFRGWFVETDAPAFDPSFATLMDFRVDQSRGIHFVYTLPFTETKALVEDTYFSTRTLARHDYEATLRRHLAQRGIDGYAISHSERGVIPMTTESFEQRPSERVFRIGLVGGLARPATGYAFLAIQRFSRKMAARLAEVDAEEIPAPPQPRSKRTQILDRCFLSHIDEHPDEAPSIFAMLFDRVPPEVLVRFLSETSSFSDDFCIMRSLPTLPFAQSMVRALNGLVRRRAATLPRPTP
jgi:lycopene beta-cyclase